MVTKYSTAVQTSLFRYVSEKIVILFLQILHPLFTSNRYTKLKSHKKTDNATSSDESANNPQ